MRRQRKNLREALLAVLEAKVPASMRDALAPELRDLDTGDVLVEQLTRDALEGDAHARDKVLELVVPKALQVSMEPDALEPYLEAANERRNRLRSLLRDGMNGSTGNGADTDAVH